MTANLGRFFVAYFLLVPCSLQVTHGYPHDSSFLTFHPRVRGDTQPQMRKNSEFLSNSNRRILSEDSLDLDSNRVVTLDDVSKYLNTEPQIFREYAELVMKEEELNKSLVEASGRLEAIRSLIARERSVAERLNASANELKRWAIEDLETATMVEMGIPYADEYDFLYSRRPRVELVSTRALSINEKISSLESEITHFRRKTSDSLIGLKSVSLTASQLQSAVGALLNDLKNFKAHLSQFESYGLALRTLSESDDAYDLVNGPLLRAAANHAFLDRSGPNTLELMDKVTVLNDRTAKLTTFNESFFQPICSRSDVFQFIRASIHHTKTVVDLVLASTPSAEPVSPISSPIFDEPQAY